MAEIGNETGLLFTLEEAVHCPAIVIAVTLLGCEDRDAARSEVICWMEERVPALTLAKRLCVPSLFEVVLTSKQVYEGRFMRRRPYDPDNDMVIVIIYPGPVSVSKMDKRLRAIVGELQAHFCLGELKRATNRLTVSGISDGHLPSLEMARKLGVRALERALA